MSDKLLEGLGFNASSAKDHDRSFKDNLYDLHSIFMRKFFGGRKEEMTKDELLKILQKGFGTDKIFSEYSMTELLSQAYSLGENIYETPNWMRVLIRNTEDPFSYMEAGRTGAINIIDLANRHSCSFISTQDLGKIVNDFEILHYAQNDKHAFQVLGRIDHSDIRGCIS